MNNNINNNTELDYKKIDDEISKMDTRDLINLRNEVLDFELPFFDKEDDYYGVSGTNYGKNFLKILYSVSRDELLKCINKRLIGKSTSDILESMNTPILDNIEESKRIMRK